MADQEAVWRWMRARIETIHRTVSASDVLRRNGVRLQYGDRREQFSCPFHGRDNKPSARIYPEVPGKPSHVWCFVCQERWDAIALWRKFEGHEKDVSFGRVLREIERAYGIVPPEGPPPEEAESEDVSAFVEVMRLYEVCERRLRAAKPLFDMRGYLILGTILDRLCARVDERKTTPEKAKETIRVVLDKIGAKERCSDAPTV